MEVQQYSNSYKNLARNIDTAQLIFFLKKKTRYIHCQKSYIVKDWIYEILSIKKR